jgi:hypothetical protein
LAHNGGGLRVATLVALAAALLACTNQTSSPSTQGHVSAAQTQAADLRTHLDLLFGEHVMIVAKESAAAINHSDEYAPYTSLLAANSSDLSALIGRAFGSTAAAQFAKAWDTQNGFLVDYAIGVVTHDDAKAKAAEAGLRDSVVLPLQQSLPIDQAYKVGGPLGEQEIDDEAFIDSLFAQKYASFYDAVHRAYTNSQSIGDALANEIVNRVPDKFPGRMDGRDVIARVAANLQLQEHSYLATMASDAAAAGRDSEKAAAVAALATNARALAKTWSDWDAAIVAYATGGALQSSAYVGRLMIATGAPQAAVQHFVQATVKVVDDQRAKSAKTLADDDRAAATATQQIADSLFQG